jgi:ketosteroid isomerase-like protein
MDDLTLIKIRFALQDLNVAFTYLLDHDRVDDLADLFTEDAVYTHGERRSEGRTAIRMLFAARSAAGVRTCRHMSTGLMLHIDGESSARGSSVCMTFAHDGQPPITPATPYLVADFDDVYRLCADGRWRIAVRDIRRIFAAAGNPGPVGAAR